MNFIREVSNSAGENSKEKSDLLKNLQSMNTHNKNKMNENLVKPSVRADILGWDKVSRNAQQKRGEKMEHSEDQLVQKMKDGDSKPWEEIKKYKISGVTLAEVGGRKSDKDFASVIEPITHTSNMDFNKSQENSGESISSNDAELFSGVTKKSVRPPNPTTQECRKGILKPGDPADTASKCKVAVD